MAEEEPINEGGEAFDFGKKRKKKKEGEGEKKKKKKEKKDKDVAEDDAEEAEEEEATARIFDQGVVYDYEDMLKRVHQIIEDRNPALSSKKKYMIKPPEIVRVGSKKIGWVNFGEICTMMNRNTDHVMQYLSAEFGSESQLAGRGQLIIKGRFTGKHIETLLRKYINSYVTCLMCKGPQTELVRDASTRLWEMQCKSCGAHKSVAPIKAGFHATTRSDRRIAKFAKIR